MKKSFTIIALAALVMLAGCKKNDPKPNGTRLIAGIEKHKSDSKTSLDGLQIKWTAGDKLYVYDKDAEEGAIFTLSSGEGTSTGEFTGTYNFTNENVAVYPSSSFSGSGGTIVTMSLPAVQTASGSGTFGNGANPMLGVFSDMDNLTLTSLCGVLCLQLTGNAHITAIEIVGGPDDKLNGTFTANYKDTDPVLAKSGDDGTNTVRLNFTETVTLTPTAQKFYVVVPAGTHGFTMKVYDGDNEIFSKSTTNDIPVSVNTLSTMNELEVTAASNIVDLSTLSESYTAQNGDIITGTGSSSLTIPGDVSVTLRDVSGTGGFNIRCMDFEPGEHSVSINLEGNNSAYNFIQVAGIKNLTISGEGSLNLDNNMSFGPGCNTTIEGTTITGSSVIIGEEFSGEENTLTIDGGSVSINGGILAYNDTNINVENDGNLTLHVTKDDWFSTVFPGIDGSSAEVNVTISDGIEGNSNLTIISYENSFTGDKFIKAQSINFGGTDVKSAWYAKTWSADGYQNFGPLRATYTASSRTLVLEPAPAPTEQIVDLSTITSAYTAVDGDILTGTLGTGVQISIADGATITLRSANINGSDNLSGTFHGLNCLGDATIILENNDNVVKANCGSENGRAGIYVPRYKTLTFEAGNSSGFVVATGSGEAAGIGGYSNNHCGVIVINSGKVTGTAGTGVDETFGDSYSAGIGSSAYKRCGGIIINGGQVIGTAYADGNAAGIGTGGNGICKKEGDTEGSQPAITISNTLSNYVKAQKGSSATYFIGGGTSSKCGIVIVGGTTYEDGGGNRGISSSTSLSYDFTVVGGNSLIYMP